MQIKGFSKIRLIFGIAFLALIFTAFYSQYNPLEKIKQKNDSQNIAYAKSFLSAIASFYQDTGRMPWTDDFGSEKGATPLMFTQITEAPVGVCKDTVCVGPGEMAIKVPVIYPVPLNSKNVFIAKGTANSDPIYACFIPESQTIREKTGNLYGIEELKKSTFTGDLPACGDNVDWKEDFCYLCIK